jgi:hypothetical protein
VKVRAAAALHRNLRTILSPERTSGPLADRRGYIFISDRETYFWSKLRARRGHILSARA